MKKSILTLVAAVMVAGGMNAHATISVTSNITTDTTWTTADDYLLEDVISVTGGSTLTIDPGVVIRGLPDSATSGADNPGTLVVTVGSTINVNGTALNPVTMTSDLDDAIGTSFGAAATPAADSEFLVPNSLNEQFGGLIVLGDTYIGSVAVPVATNSANQIEGLVAGPDGQYGGGDDDDNSGNIQYLRIRYGGNNIASDNEINGLTLGGVGRGTTVEYVEVVNNKDDGIEFFGGTVNTKYIVVANVGDDSFDYDEGFRGKGQFWFTFQGDFVVDSGNMLGEWDGTTGGDGNHPYSIPVIANMTGIGQGKGDTGGKDGGFHIRDGAGVQGFQWLIYDIDNAVFAIEGDGTAATTAGSDRSARKAELLASALVDDNDFDGNIVNYPDGSDANGTDGDPADIAEFYPDVVTGGSDYALQVIDSKFLNVNKLEADSDGGDTPSDWHGTSGDDGKGVYAPGFFASAVANGKRDYNNIGTLTAASPFPVLVRGPLPDSLDTNAGSGNVILALNPIPSSSDAALPNAASSSIPADAFFTANTYVGAFDPSGSNWADGWTTISEWGIFSGGDDVTGSVNPSTDFRFAVSFDTTTGETYEVFGSSDPAAVTGATLVATVTGDNTTQTVIDTRALSTRQFYSIVTQ